jgi:NAD(P)-dependent dehydrogenase (short-subunit alcohol dehydrogenase family)
VTKIALVTGGNRGIGFETCRQLGRQGVHVLLTSRNWDKGETAAKKLRQEGYDINYYQLDVTDVAGVAALPEVVEQQFGRLDILVNNAGVYLDEGRSIFDVSFDEIRLTMAVSFYGPLHLCRAFVPLMKQSGYGRVVNVSSGDGALTEMGGRTAAYRISKTALNALTRIVADEVRVYNIKVNAMCPGWVRTDMGGQAATRSVAEGADTVVWLATLPDDGPTSGFFRDRRPISW